MANIEYPSDAQISNVSKDDILAAVTTLFPVIFQQTSAGKITFEDLQAAVVGAVQAQLDAHEAERGKHLLDTEIEHSHLQGAGLYPHALIDAHIENSELHGGGNSSEPVSWDDIANKPDSYPPAEHSHPPTIPDYILVRDVKASGTHGGNAVAGDNIRDITEITLDAGGHASLLNHQLSLAAGTYRVQAQAVGRYVGHQRLSLYNVTDLAVVTTVSGVQSSAPNMRQRLVTMQGQFTIANPKSFEIRHSCQNARTQYGLGGALSLGDEVYLVAEFWKLA